VVHLRQRGHLGVEGHSVADHLARAIASWALEGGRTEWYSVCEARHVRALRARGLPVLPFGRIVAYQPNVPVCAMRVSLSQAAACLRARRPREFAWYTQGVCRSCSVE
jgi:hypothetical protein